VLRSIRLQIHEQLYIIPVIKMFIILFCYRTQKKDAITTKHVIFDNLVLLNRCFINFSRRLLIKQAYFSNTWWIIKHKTRKKLFFAHLTQKSAEDC
jgi:hypothetical protein